MTTNTNPPLEGKVLNSYSLTVRFDQLEDGKINYSVTPDEKVLEGAKLSFAEHLDLGGPTAFLGIVALQNKLMSETIVAALDTATNTFNQVLEKADSQQAKEPGQQVTEERVVH